MDLLMTGASGFLGAQVATQWLARHPEARIGCLVRGADAGAARARLHDALRQAALDQAMRADPQALLARADAIPGDMTDPAWTQGAQAWLRGPTELFHCAANLSFREADREQVWNTNVEGTRALLRALPAMPGLQAFNHVSTAYVAGDRQGDILEDERAAPAAFNNPYEASKWEAEGLVRAACEAAGLAWRVFRPSIIIAHSVTHRMASRSGFYQVADILMQLGRNARVRAAGGTLLLPVPHGTTLDLVPVDMVVEEMLALIALGPATRDRTFHITSDAPLSLADVLSELTPMSGVPIAVGGALAAEAGRDGRGDADLPGETLSSPALAALTLHRLRYYLPYFRFVRRFDRRHAALARPRPGIDVEALRGFLHSFLAQRLADGVAQAPLPGG